MIEEEDYLTNYEIVETALSCTVFPLLKQIPGLKLIIDAKEEVDKKRQEKLIKQIAACCSHLEEEKLDKKHLSSEDFFDIIRCILKENTKTRSEESRKIFAAIVADEITTDRYIHISTDLKEKFIEILAKVKVDDLKLLYDFHKGSLEKTTRQYFYRINRGLAFDSLVKEGLIVEKGTWDQDFMLSCYGQELVKYLLSIID